MVRATGIASLLLLVCSLSACAFSAKPGASGTGGTGNVIVVTGTGGAPPPPTPCEGLRCQQSTCKTGNCAQPACPGGGLTTLTGKVYDPAGKVPLYNVDVYIPSKPLADIADGPSCDCANGYSGDPVVKTKTDASGSFTLGDAKADVPVGDNIPLVFQIGKWRRQITIANVPACTQTALTAADQTRLPRDQSEGHIPKMALTTGSADALECLLRKVGISDSEFTPETGPGRINFYAGGGGTSSFDASLNGGAPITPANPWWDSLDNLVKYDIILHSCEGSYGSFTGNTTPPMSAKSMAARQALQTFADMGGRVFASHWHVYWFEEGTPAFQSIATFNHRSGLPNPYDATIDQSFPTGEALAQWLVNVGGSTMPGIVNINQMASARTVDTAAGGNISQRWIYASTLTPQSVQFLGATTPIPGGTCGKVVLTDLHVTAGGGAGSDMPDMPFPTGCVTTDLTPQEKVLEFMLFDIASCVIDVG
jgi:hypothetical protein